MPEPILTRRDVLTHSAAALAATAVGATALGRSRETATVTTPDAPADPATERPRFRFAVKDGMVGAGATWTEKFALLKELGYDGIELSSPNDYDADAIDAARAATGLPVHGVVDSIHWRTRLSDPDPAVRAQSRAGLETAIRDARRFGGSSVLLVPGVVDQHATEQQVHDRSIAEIRHVLPLAAELGIHILIENVWNGFCYDHDGDAHQSADRFAAYIDAIDSPWVGMYFDLGNHRKYGDVEAWVRTLGKRIVKCDVKDWGFEHGWANIGDGDVDWPAVCAALHDIGFTGWMTAEVGGGDRERLAQILSNMRSALPPA